jgi:hypothetical protein
MYRVCGKKAPDLTRLVAPEIGIPRPLVSGGPHRQHRRRGFPHSLVPGGQAGVTQAEEVGIVKHGAQYPRPRRGRHQALTVRSQQGEKALRGR